MIDIIRNESDRIANTVPMSIEYESEYGVREISSDAAARFVHAAAMLPEDKFIGWQFATECFSNHFFSSSGISFSKEDIAWIFRGCSASTPNKSEFKSDLFEKNRKVYILSVAPKNSNIPDEIEEYDFMSYDDFDCPVSKKYRLFCEMLEMMSEENGIIRFCMGNRGRIIISLANELTLRMQSILSMVFPYTEVIDACDPAARIDGRDALPPDVMLKHIKKFFYALMVLRKKAGSFYTIEELGLSVRAYNCLRRAGINTLGQLRELSYDELRNIRNLGVKSVEEIRRKIAQYIKPETDEDLFGEDEQELTEENEQELTLEPETGPEPDPEPELAHEPEEKAEPKTESSPGTKCIERLDEMIGLTEAKEQIRKIAAYAKMKKYFLENGKGDLGVSLNMEFIGNPGTAKTTVARLVAGILYEIGILEKNEMIEAGRADLVAEYVGQTAIKVRSLFKKAKGGLLFIDEAYSLVDDRVNSYGDEAINTIIQEMENSRNDTVVIFAGYPDKMKTFFDRNPGFRSRVPFTVRFRDYSADEMLKIAELEAEKRGFAVSGDAHGKIKSICAEASLSPDAGNGRFCRNLIEKAILCYASRVFALDREAADVDCILMEEDFPVPDKRLKTEKKLIGFCA